MSNTLSIFDIYKYQRRESHHFGGFSVIKSEFEVLTIAYYTDNNKL